MNSNFQFLKNEFTTFFDRAVKAEQTVITDPRTSLVYSRMALEEAINWMYAHDAELEMPYDTSLNSLMIQTQFKEQFNHKLYNDLQFTVYGFTFYKLFCLITLRFQGFSHSFGLFSFGSF